MEKRQIFKPRVTEKRLANKEKVRQAKSNEKSKALENMINHDISLCIKKFLAIVIFLLTCSLGAFAQMSTVLDFNTVRTFTGSPDSLIWGKPMRRSGYLKVDLATESIALEYLNSKNKKVSVRYGLKTIVSGGSEEVILVLRYNKDPGLHDCFYIRDSDIIRVLKVNENVYQFYQYYVE